MIQNAEIIVCLVSIDFIISNNHWIDNVESVLASKTKSKIIIPVLIRECFWQETALADFQVLPYNEKPIGSRFWKENEEEAYVEVARGIRFRLDEFSDMAEFKGKKVKKINIDQIHGIQNSQQNLDKINPFSLEQQLELIKERKNKLTEAFRASPFDNQSDLGGLLTELVFYEKLYVESSSFKNISRKFKLRINSIVDNNTVIFLSGFPGNGKTTLIRTFIKKNPAFHHQYIAVSYTHLTLPTKA